MAKIYRAGYALVVLAVISMLTAWACADEFVSEQYGFRFKIPDGFNGYEPTEKIPMGVKVFVETNGTVGDFPITIYLQHLGRVVDPSERLDSTKLPHKEGLTLSLETRHWQTLELYALRQDASVSADGPIVGYLIQFPLQEAIQLRVQGPKNREAEVMKTFDESVSGFVNTKPYVVSVETVKPGRATRAVTQFIAAVLPPFLIIGLIGFFLVKLRKSQSKT